MTPQEWADWNMQQMSECLDAPPPQESMTVKEMRSHAWLHKASELESKMYCRWADELEAANKRIAELEQQVKDAEFPISFGQKCYQDRCENAYVEASVVKMLEGEVSRLKGGLESRQPAPSREVAAIVVGACLDKSEEIHAFECTDDAIAFVRDDANDARILTRVHSWHYHESQKGAADVSD